MDDTSTGQVSRSAADVYEDFFVPALFAQWAAPMADAAALTPGQAVADVACGTGVLAREAMRRIMPGGRVVGLDRNAAMLSVARRCAPEVEWRIGRAEELPFDDAAFDAVVCQFGLMFFDDRVAALKEMWRILRPSGRLTVAVWDALERAPGYAAMTALLQELFGDRTADALRAPFVLGDSQTVQSLFAQAGLGGAAITTLPGTACFPSVEAWVRTDIKGWTLSELIDEAQYRTLQQAAQRELAIYAQPDGTVSFAAPAHIAVAVKT